MEPLIYRLDRSEPARLAAKELQRCLTKMTGESWQVRCVAQPDLTKPGLWLGRLSPRRGEKVAARDSAGVPAPEDEILIETDAAGGVIAGSNPRSILLAAYRYLTEQGCRWLRPGRQGELLPRRQSLVPVKLHEKAGYRHRGVCIEGAVSFEHVRDMIDWLPKLGFNAYFIQFRDGYNFFQRWYEHEGNPYWRGRPFAPEEAEEICQRLRQEIKRRGLALHMVGHGWTCEPFGVPGRGWFPHEGPLPPAMIPHLAEINGERTLFGNIALNTNLCYGNPETRRIVTEAIVEYAHANPDVDIIHFWLADGANNQCECALCRPHRPADLYVKMLNELDEKLTAAGLPVRIVFLAYVDLLWPPQKERLRNPDRFILMFAPITRSYSRSFTEAGVSEAPLPPYRRNRLQFPRDPAMNLAFLRAWQERFAGDSFDFDYHFMWDHYKDPAGMALARVLHRDLQGLRRIGLNGFMSCQVQRAFFPTGLGMTIMGRTLWNPRLSFRAIAEDYFAACFGEQARTVQGLLERLSALFAPPVLRGEEQPESALAGWKKIPQTAHSLGELARNYISDPEPARAYAWQILADFSELCILQSKALIARHTNAPAAAQAAWELIEWARRQEKRLHPVWDVYEFLLTFGGLLGISREELLRR